MAGGNASHASSTRGTAIAVVAAALILLVPSIATASQCSRPERVDPGDAECLSASWRNRGIFKKSTYRVRNMCAAYGRVTAKVDLVAARDRTVNLDDGRPRRGWAWRQIRSISCCSDTGICNRSDAVTDEGCLARFKQASSAPLSCYSYTASATSPGENYKCTIKARCHAYFNPFLPRLISSTITVPFVALGDVHSCGGRLQRGPCDDDPVDTTRVRVFDAHAHELRLMRHTLQFRVFLSRRLRIPVSVDYATSDITATAGADYPATSGTLTFAPGETAKTISVPVFEDGHDEDHERLMLTLSNPHPWRRVRLHDATATGTISNSDPMPKAWIARFGRTVADQVLEAVDARMRAKPVPGVEARLAGQGIGAGPPFASGPGGDVASEEAPASGLGQWSSGRALLPGSSFSLTAETGGEGLISVWGRGAATGFSGREDDVAVDGEVASAMLGADWTRGRWTTGLLLTHSRGDGGYGGAGVRHGLELGYALGERLIAAYGDGSLTRRARRTAPAPRRSDRPGSLDGSGCAAWRSTATTTHDDRCDRVGRGIRGRRVLAAAKAEVTRLRLGLEGSPFRLADGSVLTPSAEIGLRHDDGDAETGFGAEIGAGIAWEDAERGLGAELRARGLLAHEAKGFRERGISGSFAWDPAAGDRGPRLSLTQTLGVLAQGATDGLLTRRTPAGLATGEPGDSLQDRRLEARFGYGFGAFGDRFTATPEIAVGLSNAGRDYSLGWRLVRDGKVPDGRSLELSVEARRFENTSRRNAPPEHAIGFRVTSRF